MRYEGLVYRPPSEAGSLIIQATLACPHNRCAFCAMYKDRKFRVRPLSEILEDLDIALEVYGADRIQTIFLADGNTAVLSTDKLVMIGEAARERFPDLARITVYGSARFLVKKSLEQWRRVAEAGITRIHSGLESGDSLTLEAIGKGVTPEEARPGRPPFSGRSVINFRSSLFAFFYVNMRVRLAGYVAIQRLDNEILDSPIVDQERGIFGLLGITYRFGVLPPRPSK